MFNTCRTICLTLCVPFFFLLTLGLLVLAFSSFFKTFELSLLGLMDLVDSVLDIWMISATIMANLRPLDCLPVPYVPSSSALVTHSKLQTCLHTTQPLMLLTGMAINEGMGLWSHRNFQSLDPKFPYILDTRFKILQFLSNSFQVQCTSNLSCHRSGT